MNHSVSSMDVSQTRYHTRGCNASANLESQRRRKRVKARGPEETYKVSFWGKKSQDSSRWYREATADGHCASGKSRGGRRGGRTRSCMGKNYCCASKTFWQIDLQRSLNLEIDRTFDFWDTMDSINTSSFGLFWPQSELLTKGSGEQHTVSIVSTVNTV